MRVAVRVCWLWELLGAAHGVLVLEYMLMGAFRLFVATGIAGPMAPIFNTPMDWGFRSLPS